MSNLPGTVHLELRMSRRRRLSFQMTDHTKNVSYPPFQMVEHQLLVQLIQ